ncbi:hypothetical protein [Vibrio alginolyticus]|nr:hypothetical protein [Vibrio alginolyticus]
MMKSNSEAQRRSALKEKLSAICTVSVMQDDEKLTLLAYRLNI